MANSHNSNSGCFSGIFRRISCLRSLPTHPADHIPESNTIKSADHKEGPKTEAKIQAPAANPGIVARLMGLDSLPDTNWVPRKGTPDSVTRSRSVSFADYLLEFDSSQAQHRRVRTSVSFREVPTLLHQQDHGFVVVYMDNVDENHESKEMRSKLKKSEMDFGELKQMRKIHRSKNKENMKEKPGIMTSKENQGNKKKKKSSKLRDEPRRPSSKKSVNRNNVTSSKAKVPLKPVNQKKVFLEPKFTRERKVRHAAAMEVESECNSVNSSAVSVLEVDDSSIQQETNVSEASLDMELSSKRKYSPRVSYTDDLEVGAITELVRKLSTLTEIDVKESDWMEKNVIRFEGFEEISMGFEQHILDLLLHQVVDELVEFSHI